MITTKKSATVKKPSKASVARDFMKKIGAFSKNPPLNWVQKVEEHLKEHGFTLPSSSKVQIYSIKSKMMKRKKNTTKSVAPKKQHTQGVKNLSIQDLSAAKKYATVNGGVEKCVEIFKALQLLTN